jgi:hypothetical protein
VALNLLSAHSSGLLKILRELIKKSILLSSIVDLNFPCGNSSPALYFAGQFRMMVGT